MGGTEPIGHALERQSKDEGAFALTVVFLMVQSGISAYELATLKVNDQIKLIAHRGDVS